MSARFATMMGLQSVKASNLSFLTAKKSLV